MKYIKTYENRNIDSELVEQFDDNFIEEHFRDNYEIDINEISNYINIWRYVDDDRFVDDYIDDYVNSAVLKDLCDYDYREYIKDKLIDNEEVQKYLDKISKKKELDPEIYYEDVLKELSENQLRKIIEKQNEEEECIRYTYEERYSSMDAKEILEEIYGEKDLAENAYKYVSNYVNDDEIIKDWIEEEDFDFKKEFVSNSIENERDLQKKLLDINSENAIILFEIMDDNPKYSIGDEYDFQKIFMEEVMKLKEENEEDDLFVAKKLKELYDKYGLDDDIEEEYEDYTFYIDTEKYNL